MIAFAHRFGFDLPLMPGPGAPGAAVHVPPAAAALVVAATRYPVRMP